MTESIRVNEDSVCCFRSISHRGLRVCWELLDECNLNCPHCLVYPATRPPLELARMFDVVGEMKAAGVRKVLLSGGEPLLFRGLAALCAKLAENGILIDLNTNATLATRDRLRELRDAGVGELTVSLDGASITAYARCRSGAALGDVVRNIGNARRLGFDVDVVYVPTRLNVDEIEDVAELAALLDASSLTVAGLIPFQRGASNRAHLELDASEIAALWHRIDRIRATSPLPIRTNRLVTAKPAEACGAGTTICGIDASGYVHPCPLYILPSGPANDLLLHRFDEIVSAPGFAVRAEPTAGCPDCASRATCQGGCLGVKRILDIPLTEPDPLCNVVLS